MGHLGLHVLAAYTAPSFLASCKALLVGDTSHGWTWAAEAGAGGDAGVDVAIYGVRSVTGGLLVIALCGNVAGGTPGGTIAPDVGGGNKVWGGCGFIPTGSALAWTTWTNANPMTNGTWAGWSPIHVISSNLIATKVQIWTFDGGLVVRLDGATTTNARMMIVGDMLLPYTDAEQRLVTAPTTQAHGVCIGWWTTGGGNPLGPNWLTDRHGAASTEFGLNVSGVSAYKGRYLDGTTLRPCRLHLPLKTISATTCRAAGKDGGIVCYIARDDASPDDTILGIHPHVIGAINAAGGEIQVGGIPVEIIVSRNSIALDPALLMSVARRSRAL